MKEEIRIRMTSFKERISNYCSRLKKHTIQIVVLVGIILILLIIWIYMTPYLSNEASTSTTQYLLSAVIQSLSAIFAVVITITLVAIQLASQTYSPRIMQRFTRNAWFWLLIGIYFVAIIINLLILSSVGPEKDGTKGTVPYLLMGLSIELFGICILYLCIYVIKIIDQLNPESVIKALLRDIDPLFIKELEKVSRSDKRLPPDRDPVLSVVDLIVRAVRNDDISTARSGVREIGNRFSDLCDKGVINHENVELVAGYFIENLSKIRDVSIKHSNSSTIEGLLSTLEKIGNRTVGLKSDRATFSVIYSFEIIGDKIIETSEIDSGWDDTLFFTSSHLGELSSLCIKKGLIDSGIFGIMSLEAIGVKSAERGFDKTIFQIAWSLEEIGTYAAENEIKVTEYLPAKSLGMITGSRIEKILETRFSDLEGNKEIYVSDLILDSLQRIKHAAPNVTDGIEQIDIAAREIKKTKNLT